MRVYRTFLVILALVVPAAAAAQSLPVIPAKVEPKPAPNAAPEKPAAKSEPKPEPKPKTAPLSISFFPLAAASEEQVKTFYGENSFGAASQVEFLYGFGASRKTLRAEMATLLFPRGLRVSLLGAVTADSEKKAGTETPVSAIEGLRSGGDTSLRLIYPIAVVSGSSSMAYLIAAPSLDFTFAGPGKSENITESTQWSADIAAEGYVEFNAIDKAGKFFASARAGRQRVSPEFAKAAKLTDSSFPAGQFAAGIEFKESVRISIQRFLRPKTTDPAVSGDLAKWRLIVQLTPKKKGS